jgi:hypothetical protein
MYGEIRAFSTKEKAQAFADEWNDLLPVFRQFSIEENKMFDFHMEAKKENVWADDSDYMVWYWKRLDELGIQDKYTPGAKARVVEEVTVE